jgi:hypothetical protein
MHEVNFTSWGSNSVICGKRVCSEHNYDNKIKLISLEPIFLLLQVPQVYQLQLISDCWAKF